MLAADAGHGDASRPVHDPARAGSRLIIGGYR
jgi:hypothetical protein